jgi:pimeloyl-ACP methyl ester carboxylesterase
VVSADYGRSYAGAFRHGQYQPVPQAAHFPHIEQPAVVLAAIGSFAGTVVKPEDD